MSSQECPWEIQARWRAEREARDAALARAAEALKIALARIRDLEAEVLRLETQPPS